MKRDLFTRSLLIFEVRRDAAKLTSEKHPRKGFRVYKLPGFQRESFRFISEMDKFCLFVKVQ